MTSSKELRPHGASEVRQMHLV